MPFHIQLYHWGALIDELCFIIFNWFDWWNIFSSFSILPRNEIQPQLLKHCVGDRSEMSSSRWAWQRFGEQLKTTLRGFLVTVNIWIKLEHYKCDWAGGTNALIQVYLGSLLTPSTAGSKFDPYKRDFNLRSGKGWEKQPSNPHGLAAGVCLFL